MDPLAFATLLRGAEAMAIALARVLGCAMFLPIFGRRHMASLHRNAICIALSLPQAASIWVELGGTADAGPWLAALALKEALLGCALGLALSVPFWALSGACTLIDNQRGANAAQQINPSLAADSSILGEAFERLLIVLLAQAGMFKLAFAVIVGSYAVWPALAPMPDLSDAMRAATLGAVNQLLADSMLYAAPVLLVLMAVEFALAIASSAIKGLEVYQTAMPIKTLLAIFTIVLCLPGLADHVVRAVETWWAADVLRSMPR